MNYDDRPLAYLNSDVSNNGSEAGCQLEDPRYDSGIGMELAMPPLEALLTTATLLVITIFTIVGNILVILSVFTYRPLRTVQNFFIVSLAVADLTVAVLVMPLNVAYNVIGRWQFGISLCKMWLTCDVLCCTASILNLCAIALDRYWAITDPINYALKRTLKRVLLMILGVWVLSAVISSPPLLGWNDWPENFEETSPCELTKKQGYVIYSSLGSFYIPLLIMGSVYVEIFIATRRRLRDRAKQTSTLVNSKLTVNATNMESVGQDNDSQSSEVNVTELETMRKEKKKKKKQKNNDSLLDQQEGSSGSQKAPEYKPPAFRVDQFIEEKQRISLSKERKAARTLGIIMGVFVVCWLPFFLMYVILPFCVTCCPTGKFINFITWLGYINSSLNPIIYTIFNMDFRKAFKKLLRIKN